MEIGEVNKELEDCLSRLATIMQHINSTPEAISTENMENAWALGLQLMNAIIKHTITLRKNEKIKKNTPYNFVNNSFNKSKKL